MDCEAKEPACQSALACDEGRCRFKSAAESVAETGCKALAVSAGGDQTCALVKGNRIKCWAFNEQGELGLGDANSRGDGPDQLGDNLPAVKLYLDTW